MFKALLASVLLATVTVPIAVAQGQVKRDPVIKPPTDISKLPAPPPSGPTARTQERAAGCIKHQLYNVQSVEQMSVSLMLETSAGDRNFNFEGREIRYIPSGSPLPLGTTAETLRWTRLLDTLERAAAANKPLLIDYEMPSGEVFGIYVQWAGACPARP